MNTYSNKVLLLLSCLWLALAFSACSSTQATGGGASSNNNKTAANTSASGGDSIGVPECDAYLQKYESCLNDKVPESARAMLRTSFEQTRNSWKTTAATPEGRAGLAQACRAADDAAKQSMSAYGCKW